MAADQWLLHRPWDGKAAAAVLVRAQDRSKYCQPHFTRSSRRCSSVQKNVDVSIPKLSLPKWSMPVPSYLKVMSPIRTENRKRIPVCCRMRMAKGSLVLISTIFGAFVLLWHVGFDLPHDPGVPG